MKVRWVGIVNVTPDSFSDGGQAYSAESAVESIETLFKQGATMVDVGAESTRPNAILLSPEEEWERLGPVFTLLATRHPSRLALISVDTRHPETVARVLPYNIGWINDVTGFSDPRMLDAVQSSSCYLVVMHSLGVPADPKITLSGDQDVIEQLLHWMHQKLERFDAHGIDRSRIIFDPGIGFGKTSAQSLELIRRAGELRAAGTRLLIGHSRKSFLRSFTSAKPQDRDTLTALTSVYLCGQGVDYVRVHNVEVNQTALHYWDTLHEVI